MTVSYVPVTSNLVGKINRRQQRKRRGSYRVVQPHSPLFSTVRFVSRSFVALRLDDDTVVVTMRAVGAPHPSPLLDIANLRISFSSPRHSSPAVAVDGISLTIPRGRTVALVGESGCGKSVTALSLMRLLPTPPACIKANHVRLYDAHRPADSIDLLDLSEREMRRVRGGRIAMIFQEPLTSLNPVYTVGEQIIEAIVLHQSRRGRAARRTAADLLARVGIPAPVQRLTDYPHQLSGGMRQRVMIAMALACRPSLLIADEPTTALDVSIQAEILQLLRDLQSENGMSMLLITHDLGVVAEVAHEVYVMYAGRIVEHAPADELLRTPLHPYTRGLLNCMPRLSRRAARLADIPGAVPDPRHMVPGCRFHPRCDLTRAHAADPARITWPSLIGSSGPLLRRCVEVYESEPSGQPVLRELSPGHHVACWEAT